MVQEIDFLSVGYHQNRKRRKKTLWRRISLVVVLTLIVLGTFQERRAQLALRATRDHLQQQAAGMMAKLQNPDVLQKRIANLDAKANLVTHLHIRVPATRVIASVTKGLPPHVTLTELRSVYEKVKRNAQFPAATSNTPPGQSDKSPEIPEAVDLDQLKKSTNESALFVTLGGIAPDDVSVSRYLGALQETNTFDDVQLLFTDQFTYREFVLRSFSIRLRVKRPGMNLPTKLKSESESEESHDAPVTELGTDVAATILPASEEKKDKRNDSQLGKRG